MPRLSEVFIIREEKQGEWSTWDDFKRSKPDLAGLLPYVGNDGEIETKSHSGMNAYHFWFKPEGDSFVMYGPNEDYFPKLLKFDKTKEDLVDAGKNYPNLPAPKGP